MGRRKAASQSTLCHFPPLPPIPLQVKCPDLSSRKYVRHRVITQMGTRYYCKEVGRLCGGCLFLLCPLCSWNLILFSHAHTDTPSLMLHLQYPSPSLPPISTHTHTRFLWIKQGAPLPLVLSCCDGEVHPHLIMYQREDRGREL